MKLILFFAAAGLLSEAQQAQRTAIMSKFPGARVSPRNADPVGLARDSLEVCDAVTGDPIPARYQERYPVLNPETMELSEDPREVAIRKREAALSTVAQGNTPPADLNPQVTGLPQGHPQNRDDLKKALKEAEVPFHGGLATPKLVDLYLSEVLKETPPQP